MVSKKSVKSRAQRAVLLCLQEQKTAVLAGRHPYLRHKLPEGVTDTTVQALARKGLVIVHSGVNNTTLVSTTREGEALAASLRTLRSA